MNARLLALSCLVAAFAGCVAESPDGPTSTIRLVFSVSDVREEAVGHSDEYLPTSVFFTAEGSQHAGYATAFDQLQSWAMRHDVELKTKFYASFDDFLVESILGVPASVEDGYWTFVVNGNEPGAGMGRTRIYANDVVTWTYTSLSPPATATSGTPTSGASSTTSTTDPPTSNPATQQPLSLAAPSRVEGQNTTFVIVGTATPGVQMSALIDPLPQSATQPVLDASGRWTLVVTQPVYGHTNITLLADDGTDTATAQVLLVRFATATVKVDYKGFPTRTNREDIVAFDPGTLSSAAMYAQDGATHPAYYNAHDLMEDWSRATDTTVVYGFFPSIGGYTVDAIDGVGDPIEGGSGAPLHAYWCFDHNGATAAEGISSLPLAPGDVLEWHLGCA